MSLYNNNYPINSNTSVNYFKDDVLLLKQFLNCFCLFENRIIESYTFDFGNFIFIDVGFKYIIKVNKTYNKKDYTLLKFIKLETLFNDSLIDFVTIKNSIIRKNNWSVIKKAFDMKSILPGKILNPVKNGFSVGICGFVGFMPKSHAIINKFDLKSVFIINSINIVKKTFVLSQKQMDKTAYRLLFKLSSQISYISKN